MMPERQKPSAGRDDREKQLSFYPPKASVGTALSHLPGEGLRQVLGQPGAESPGWEVLGQRAEHQIPARWTWV